MKQYQKRNRFYYFAALTAILISTLFAVVLQFFKGKILDSAIAGDRFTAIRCVLLLLLFVLFENLFYYLYAWFTARFVTRCTRILKRDIFKSILRRSYVSYQKHPQGWYLSKYTNEADAIQSYRFQLLPKFWEILIKVIFVSAALFLLDGRIAILTLALLTTPLYLPKLIEKPLQDAQSAQVQTVESALTNMQDWLRGFEIIKNFSVEETILQKFDVVNDHSMNAMFHNTAWQAVSQLLTSLMSYLSYFAILAYSTWLILTGEFSAGDFFVAIGMIDQLSYPIIMLADILRAFVAIRPTCRSVEQFLSEDQKTADIRTLHAVYRNIQYHAVSFAYPGASRPVLQNVTFTVQKGRRYLLKGPSGCGKTTAVNLLLRYYNADSGEILVDDIPLSRFDSTYDCMTVVRQDAVLFCDSLRNNLTLYQNIPDEKLFLVLHAVKLDKFANRDALDSLVAENGTNFSGGEKKRICLARALLQNTDVLILDEPLANLDDATASKIEDLLLSIEGKIVLVVSHQFTPEKLALFDGVIQFGKA